ncbi:hypothetical protein VHEMI05862 [[Torrubiella] hemipterigena]|uniref:Uncharacterized protein n=1 Tax=[Torrubiella] hemipterigena TaxID=1531966 RepID=A0A0A1TI10_9HYPO|nr:hypothetical protein VHEMI05862 [[Torrubiella] hemipterigena]
MLGYYMTKTVLNVLRSVLAFYPILDNKTIFSDYISLTQDSYYRILAYRAGAIPMLAQVDSFYLEFFTYLIVYQARARELHGVPV